MARRLPSVLKHELSLVFTTFVTSLTAARRAPRRQRAVALRTLSPARADGRIVAPRRLFPQSLVVRRRPVGTSLILAVVFRLGAFVHREIGGLFFSPVHPARPPRDAWIWVLVRVIFMYLEILTDEWKISGQSRDDGEYIQQRGGRRLQLTRLGKFRSLSRPG
jgi:hypothetical protein